jgi:spermidine synthase
MAEASEPKRAQRLNAIPGPVRFSILACFFLSGAAGLVYEVVWARQLGLFLGITSFAHTAVITAYMAGLAAGSLYFGRRADGATSPLKIYAWLEVGVGLYAAVTPWMFEGLQAGYAGLTGTAGVSGMPSHLVRFTIAMAALLVPTFLMGGTLPLLVRGFARSLPELGLAASRLYGLNTLGAMTGTLAAGYLLIPIYGLTLSVMVGVALNIGIALLVLALLKWVPEVGEISEEPTADALAAKSETAQSRSMAKIDTRFAILFGFGLAGFASLLTQLAWIRALILVIGGSVYAFTITLASFLAGIGLGSLAYARFLGSKKGLSGDALNSRRLMQAAGLALLISLTLLAGLAMIGRLPAWFLGAWASGLHANFAVFQLFVFLLCFSLMILPTLFMGALFPLVTVVWTRRFSAAGRGVGQAYAINTTGTIFGALLGGLLILPWLGIHGSLLLTSAMYLFVTLLFWLAATSQWKASHRALGAAVALMAVAISAWQVPSWDRMLMSAGTYYRPEAVRKKLETRDGQDESERILYYEEGLDGIVTVKTDGKSLWLAVNGKTDASSLFDMPTQVLLGRLPLQLGRQMSEALVIGLGSGITAGTVARSEQIKSLTVLELSSEVVKASEFFREHNHDVLKDPRVTLVTADARNYLLAADRQFDLIVSEPSNPWISGISNLFTAEAFDLARQRLAPGGVMVQWFHMYSMSTDDLKSVLHTFAGTFPHVSVWQPMSGDLVMLGSDQPHQLRLSDADGGAAVNREELARAGILNDRDLVRKYMLGDETLRRYAGSARLNTDAHPVIEFSAPRNLYAETLERNLEHLVTFLGGASQAVPIENLYRVDGNVIRADAMSLDIALREEAPPRELQGEWSLARRLMKVDDDPALGVGSGRRLSWREGVSEFYLQATWHKEMPDRTQLLNTLKSLFKDEGVRGGDITLIGGHEGVWLQGETGIQGRYSLGVAWSCGANPDGFTRYAAFEDKPADGADDWGHQLTRLAERFRCRTDAKASAASE